MSAYPTTLPRPSSDYGIDPVDPVARTEMESGASRSRRRTYARNDHINVVWEFTDAQMAVFRAWFDSPTEASGGAAWFTVSLLTGDGGFRTVEAKFAAVFTSKYSDYMRWFVTAKLEVR